MGDFFAAERSLAGSAAATGRYICRLFPQGRWL